MPYALRVIGVNLKIVLIKIVLPAIPALPLLYYLRSALDLNSLILLVCAASPGLLTYLLAYLVLNNRSLEVDIVRSFFQRALHLFRDRPAPGGTGF